ncbi:MAG: helix-turn-helix transcriptional regulator [Acidithiobacillus sp.]|jgi:hypothetical protein|uniref:helix-turn-helix domain-containing protein n=1 Tax=Acidithiobacillus sp. TaxID=1872118 RepID=UPI0035606CEF
MVFDKKNSISCPPNSKAGCEFRRIRELKNITVVELSKKIGKSPTIIYNIESTSNTILEDNLIASISFLSNNKEHEASLLTMFHNENRVSFRKRKISSIPRNIHTMIPEDIIKKHKIQSTFDDDFQLEIIKKIGVIEVFVETFKDNNAAKDAFINLLMNVVCKYHQHDNKGILSNKTFLSILQKVFLIEKLPSDFINFDSNNDSDSDIIS